MYLLGIDLGSSSVKVALLKAESQVVFAEASYPKIEMKIDSPQHGWAEQDPASWWENLHLAIREVMQESSIKATEILAIGIAYQMHGLVLVDKAQKVLRPSIIWCDSRAVDLGQEAFESLGQDYCRTHYLNSPGNFTASKLKWVKENEPALFAKIHKAMLPGDYLAMKMTGQVYTTISGLSEGIFWDFQHGKIAHKLLDHFGLDARLLPDLKDTFGRQGKLTAKAATELGLAAGIPISYRAGDQPNNAFSLGVVHPNQVAGTGGTSGVVYGVVDAVNTDLHSRVNGFAHVNHSHQDPRIGILLCINGAGSQYAWLKKNIAEDGIDYQAMADAQKDIPIGSDGLRILSFGNGAERMLEHNYQGAQIFNLQFNKHSRAHLYRAALEGIAFAFVYGLEIMHSLGIKPKHMRVGNDNLFQSEIFTRTIATLADLSIDLVDTTGAIGAAKGAGYGIGYYPTLDAAIGNVNILKTLVPEAEKEQYLEAYRDWKSILEKQYKS